MADVFISYSSEDRNRVRPLAEALQARGFSVWWDRSLGAGQDYATVIDREIKAAKAVIVVWTQASAASTFVRDEAGRARDEGRLVPVMLDKVQIPLGFGSFQAEDFSNWNGGANAAQMQLLTEALRAKLEGRDIDGDEIARKRRRTMARVRLVSVLSVLAAIVLIAAGLNSIYNPNNGGHVQQPDRRALLLQLLADGKITPEQAIELAKLLEAGALGDQQVASNEDDAQPSPAQPAPSDQVASEESPGAAGPLSSETGSAAPSTPVQSASVSDAEFRTAASETWQSASTILMLQGDDTVRKAVVDMSNPTTRQAAMQTLWDVARTSDNAQLRLAIYQVCGAAGEPNADPLAQQALETAAELQPEDQNTWRILSRSYTRSNRSADASAAALAGDAAEANAQGNTAEAEQALTRALPNLSNAGARAAVASQLGSIAERRQDWDAASRLHAEAYRLREQTTRYAPAPVAQETLQQDAISLARALDKAGRTREACVQLRQAQEAHQIEADDQDLVNRCQALRVTIRPSTRLRDNAITTAPARTTP